MVVVPGMPEGVKVIVPVELSAGWTLKRVGSSAVTVKVSVWLASLAGPRVMPVAHPVWV